MRKREWEGWWQDKTMRTGHRTIVPRVSTNLGSALADAAAMVEGVGKRPPTRTLNEALTKVGENSKLPDEAGATEPEKEQLPKSNSRNVLEELFRKIAAVAAKSPVRLLCASETSVSDDMLNQEVGTVPFREHAESRNDCNLTSLDQVDGRVPPSNEFDDRSSVVSAVRLPSASGKPPESAVPAASSCCREVRLAMIPSVPDRPGLAEMLI